SNDMPLTEGVICSKVAHKSAAFVHGPGRLTHPLRRIGPKGSGKFEAISWDAALDLIHAKVSETIAEHGREAVMPLNYAGPHGLLAMDSMSLRFFNKLGASQLYRRALCGGVRSEAWAGTYGAVGGIGPEAAAAAKLNVVWGNNATVANLHLVRNIRKSKRQGGRLVVVDPLRTKIAEQADLHLGLRPGTDVVLAFALATELERLGAHDTAFIAANVHGHDAFMDAARPWTIARAADVCGLAAEDLATLAAWMAEADPLVVALGNGLERGRNGGSGIRAAIALPALLGKLDARNGLVLGAGNVFPKTPAKLARPDLLPGPTRTLNIVDIGLHLAEDDISPPLRALFIYNHNPAVVHGNQNRMRRGLMRDDVFLAGIDVQMTESMALCDVVLPAATHFEQDDLFCSYGHHWLQRAQAVIPPIGQSLPNTEIFRRLAHRFGFQDACFKASDKELMDDALDGSHPAMQGRKPSEVPLKEPLRITAVGGAPLALFVTHQPATPTGKVELVSDVLAERWGPEARLPRFRPNCSPQPLMLISPASGSRISSTLLGDGGLPDEAPVLRMNPKDADARQLGGCTRVRVFNDLGEVILPLHITDAVPPGVVASEKGAWLATSPTGQTISALVSTELKADLAEGACFNDVGVEVEAA
ncbi:MAG: molybdopterin-dependent oxidoreductase, partial [Hyphomicrobiaceae bacterium]